MTAEKKISVLVVDDSLVVRIAARELLSRQPDFLVLDMAIDPIDATERMEKVWPDVIVLDIQMPRMDGLSFLRKIMRERPTPIVMCSSLVADGGQAGIDALAAGAVSLIGKPKVGVPDFFKNDADNIVTAVRAAAQANVRRLRQMVGDAPTAPPTPKVTQASLAPAASHERLIALGASTGGTEALTAVLTALPANMPPIVVVQHMPKGYTKMFADRLDKLCALSVSEANHGDKLIPGKVLIAQAGMQMRVARNASGYFVEVQDGPHINRHKPSVDCLFSSVARHAGARGMGVIMTGIGDDGALGLDEMRKAGATTVAEAEETCVVFGMPRAAIARGAVQTVAPLHDIARHIGGWVSRH